MRGLVCGSLAAVRGSHLELKSGLPFGHTQVLATAHFCTRCEVTAASFRTACATPMVLDNIYVLHEAHAAPDGV